MKLSRFTTCVAAASFLLTAPALAADQCNFASAKQIVTEARSYVTSYRATVPAVDKADEEIFERASLIFPPTDAVAQLRVSPSYKTWVAWRTTKMIESSLALFGTLNPDSPKLIILARIAYLSLSVEESQRELAVWLNESGIRRPSDEVLHDLDLDYIGLQSSYSIFFLACMADKA